MRVLLLISIFSLVKGCNLIGQRGNFENINDTQMEELMVQKDVRVIDVRSTAEIRQGYINESDHFIDFYSPDWEVEVNKLDKNYSYIVYCRSGARSVSVADKMGSNGFKKVYNLRGGIMGWKNKTKIVTQ
jgi:phage shock protein E